MKANLGSVLSDEAASSRMIQQELAVSKVANMVKRLMKEKGTTNADLARKLGKDPGYVSRVLSGKMNLTLSTVADILWALDSSIEVTSKPIDPQEIPPHLLRRPEWSQGWDIAEDPSFWSRGRSNEEAVS